MFPWRKGLVAGESLIMNPYAFVPTDFSKPPQRSKPLTHEKFQGRAGRIECRLTAETPIFIPENRERLEEFEHEPQTFITRSGLPVIPGSSLKGLLRSLVETVGNGCYLLFDGKYERRRTDYSRKLPEAFHNCSKLEELCIACRMFGMLERRKVLLGNVSVSDARTRPGEYTEHDPIYTKPLMTPKPRHQAFYLNEHGQIAGRKFYFHSPNQIQTDTRKTPYNQHICPLNPGSRFTFTVDFQNIRDAELAVLLYALVLEQNPPKREMRHKIGLAKPVGLGSVKIEITKISLIDYQRRYTTSAAPDELTGRDCEAYLAEQLAPLAADDSDTLTALRTIWAWKPDDDTRYVYPGQSWFRANSAAPLEQTP